MHELSRIIFFDFTNEICAIRGKKKSFESVAENNNNQSFNKDWFLYYKMCPFFYCLQTPQRACSVKKNKQTN
ncbi:hypothetical protein ASE21_11495 [Flavobacterium sp. Root901]|nr:hypothetical protein ASE21_11495 [Flavobacterium sp. Root901]